jgi:hypothetical protein
MKNLLLIILITVSNSLFAQTYTIIHVIGKIYDTASGAYLKSGTRLSESSQLKFETPTARAAVLSSSRGRYVIQKKGAATNQSDLSYALSSVLAPARGKLSTRAGGINNQMDFKKKFDEGTTAWLGNTYQVEVSNTSYPLDESHFFYVSYLYNGEAINKKLEGKDGIVTFDKSFFAIDGQAIDPSMTSELTLFYYNADQEESSQITSLDFIVVSLDELRTILDGLSELSDEEKNNALIEIIQSMYGKTSAKEIEAAIKSLN